MISACMTAYNEAEVLPYSLKFLASIPHIKEICIVIDSACTDDTKRIVHTFHCNKLVHYKTRKFDNFSGQKNAALDMALQDWILWIDADETYTGNIVTLFDELANPDGNLKHVNSVRFPTITMLDARTMYQTRELAPHTRMWKKGYVHYVGDLHESPISIKGENLQSYYPIDGLYVKYDVRFEHIYMKHNTFFKSDETLREKARRWNIISGQQWDENHWVNAKHECWKNAVPLSEIFYDATTLEV